jgi:hypothetical protein
MLSIENDYPTPWHWWLLTVVGIAFVICGTILKEVVATPLFIFLGIIVFGLGMSLIGALFVKISNNDLGRIFYKRWRKNYIEIFTESRQEEAEKYTAENKNITRELLLLSVSASKAIQELNNENSTLFKKLVQGIEMQFIILDPSSDSATERAKADNPDNPGLGKEEMKDEFLKIENLLNLLNQNHMKGKLLINATIYPISTTIYCHQNRLVFGPYFPHSRGDTHGSYSICPKFNNKLYTEYYQIFSVQLGKSTPILESNHGIYSITPEYLKIKSQLT